MQTYPAEQIKAGQLRFSAQCGFCHGRDAAGGETGPDLTRSHLVAEDVRGDKLAPMIRDGRPEKGMPALGLNDSELAAVIAFIHDQKTKFETLGGGRRSVSPADLAVGSAKRGRKYFSGRGGCSGCHSTTGDLAGIATRYQGLQLLQRLLYPTLSAAARSKNAAAAASTTTPASGQANINPLDAHFEQLGKYTDRDAHNVYDYLETLK